MDLLRNFGSDLEKEKNGVWIKLHDKDGSPGKILIARYNNPKFKEVFKRLLDEFRLKINEGDDLSNDKINEEVLSRALAESVLIGWSDLFIAGKEIPYSVENSYKILTNPLLKDFRDRIVSESTNLENYRISNMEDDCLKSLASSFGI